MILSVKEVNRKTRDVAFDLLISLARRMIQTNDGDAQGVVDESSEHPLMSEYTIMPLGGLAGRTPRMKSATVLALSRVVYEFKFSISQETMSEILATVLMLLREKAREVIKSVLGFCKVCILCLAREAISPHLSELIKGLTLWCNDSKNRFRQKIRILFEMLIKKFGFDMINDMVPPTHTALLLHIKKTKEKEAKLKAAAWSAKKSGMKDSGTGDFEQIFESDDDDSDQEEENKKSKNQSGRGKQEKKGKSSSSSAPKMWIRDSEVDFLDSSAMKHVVTSDPKQAKPATSSGLGS